VLNVSVMGFAIVIYTLLDNVNAKACLVVLVILTSFMQFHYLASIVFEMERIIKKPLFVSQKSLELFNTTFTGTFDVSFEALPNAFLL
jgi:hypothetical protein